MGYFITLAGGICWGLSGCCGQYLLQQKGCETEWLVACRLLSAGVILSIIALWCGKKDTVAIFRNKKDLIHLAVFSVFGILFCQYTYFAAIRYSNAGTATVLQYLAPVIVLTVVCLKKKRLPDRRETAAILLSLLGVLILGTHGNLTSLCITPAALAWGLISAVASACYSLLSGDLIKKYGTFLIAGFGMVFTGTIMCILVKPWTYEVVCDSGMAWALAGVIIIGTAAGNSLYLFGVSLIGPLKASLLASIEPVVSVAVSFLWLHTSFVWIDYIGFAMIVSTIFVLNSNRIKGTFPDKTGSDTKQTQNKTQTDTKVG